MTDHAQDAIMADAVLSEHEDPSLLAGMLNNRAIFWVWEQLVGAFAVGGDFSLSTKTVP